MLDADCSTTGATTRLQLLTRPAPGGRPTGVISLSTLGKAAGVPQPSPTAAVVVADGIAVSAAGRGNFVAQFGAFRLETAGLSAAETRAIAREAKKDMGRLSATAALLVGWPQETVTGSDPVLAATENWYADFQSAIGSAGPDVNHSIHRRNADDTVNEPFWQAARVATADLGRHRAFLLDNGPVRFVSVNLTPDVIMMLQVPGGNAVQTAGAFVSSLEKVPASDPRIIRPTTLSPSPSPNR